MATQYNDGFALPTVIIASVIMMTLLLSGLVATTSISSTVRSNHYNSLAAEAAEAGIAFMQRCAQEDTIPSTGTFTPKSTSCSNASDDASKSQYLIDTATINAAGTAGDPQPERVRSTYSLPAPTGLDGDYYSVLSTGTVEVYRPNGSVARTYTVEKSYIFQNQVAVAASSSSGDRFVCGIVNKKARCWGRNQEGQVGTGSVDPGSNEYYQDASGNPITNQVVRKADNSNSQLPTEWHELSITAGGSFACAVTENSTNTYSSRKNVCWGTNTSGQMGNVNHNLNEVLPYPQNTQTPWESDGSRYPVLVKAGLNHACTLVKTSTEESNGDNGKVWCWGTNVQGQLGLDHSNGPQRTPAKVVGTGGSSGGVNLAYIDVSAGPLHACGFNANGWTVCWGDNEYGQVGNNTSGNNQQRPTNVVTSSSPQVSFYATDIAVGGYPYGTDQTSQTCAVGKDTSNDSIIREGSLWCWGNNNFGQIGKTDTSTSGIYRRANEIPYVCNVDCSAGNQHSNYIAKKVAVANRTACAYVELPSLPAPNDRVVCWGGNDYGELGIGEGSGTTPYLSRPRVLTDPNVTGKTVTAMQGGAFRFCAVVSSTNYCWGRDHTAQIGDGEANSTETSPKRSVFLEPDRPGIVY